MATNLTMGFSMSGALLNALDLTTITDSFATNDTFAPLVYTFASGTSSGQFDNWWHDSRTVTATTYDNLDLRGGTVSTKLNLILDFQKIKLGVISIRSPDGTKSLLVGPQNITNAWQGPWGGVGATVYTTVLHSHVFAFDPYTGFAVAAGTGDILGIYNPGASSVTYDIFLLGIQA